MESLREKIAKNVQSGLAANLACGSDLNAAIEKLKLTQMFFNGYRIGCVNVPDDCEVKVDGGIIQLETAIQDCLDMLVHIKGNYNVTDVKFTKQEADLLMNALNVHQKYYETK